MRTLISLPLTRTSTRMALDPSASLLVRVRQSLGADGLLAALNEAQHCAKMAYSKINAKAETLEGWNGCRQRAQQSA